MYQYFVRLDDVSLRCLSVVSADCDLSEIVLPYRTLTSIVDSDDQRGFTGTVDSDIRRGLRRPTWIPC